MSRDKIRAEYVTGTGRNRLTADEVDSVVLSYEKIIREGSYVQLTTWHAWHGQEAEKADTPFNAALHQHFLSLIETTLEVRP